MVSLEDSSQIKCKPENLMFAPDEKRKVVSKDEEDSDEIPDLVASSDDDSPDDTPPISTKLQPPKKPDSVPKAAPKAVAGTNNSAGLPRSSAQSKVSNTPVNSTTSQSKLPAKSVPAVNQPVSRQANPKFAAMDDDEDEPPELVSSSDDDDDAGTAKTAAAQPIPPRAAAKQVVPPARPVAPSPVTPSPAEQKRELQQFISRLMEEGRCAFMRAEYDESFRKYNEILIRLERLSDAEKRENQRHFARSYTWIAESHLQRGLYDLATTNGQKAMVCLLLI